MEQKKNKDKLVSKQKKQQEIEKKPELSRKEEFPITLVIKAFA